MSDRPSPTGAIGLSRLPVPLPGKAQWRRRTVPEALLEAAYQAHWVAAKPVRDPSLLAAEELPELLLGEISREDRRPVPVPPGAHDVFDPGERHVTGHQPGTDVIEREERCVVTSRDE